MDSIITDYEFNYYPNWQIVEEPSFNDEGLLEKAGYNWKEQAPRHPNTEGHKIFAEELYKFYNKVYK